MFLINKILNKLVPFLEQNNYIIYSTGGTMKEVLKYIKDKTKSSFYIRLYRVS